MKLALALLLLAACGSTSAPAEEPPVSNAETSTAPPVDAAPACPGSCTLDEVGCLLIEDPPPCCAHYSQPCRTP